MALMLIPAASCSQRVLCAGGMPVTGYEEPVDTLPDIIKKIEVIPLEVTENSMLKGIVQVECVNSSYIVSDDSDRIFRFSSKGKYLNRIGNEGRAEAEYLRVDTFMIDSLNRVVIFDGATDKLLIFNPDGTFVKVIRFPSGTLRFINAGVQLKGDNMLVNDRIFNYGNTLYSLLSTHEKKKKEIANTPLRSPEVACYIGEHPISMWKGNLKFLKPFDKRIYTLNDKDEIVPVMTIATSKKLAGDDILSKPEETNKIFLNIRKKGYFEGFTSIFETEKYILLDNWHNDEFLIDKSTMTGYRIRDNEIIDSMLMVPRMSIIASTDDSFISGMDSITLMVVNDMFDNNMPGYKKPEFLQKINSFPKDANPCLVKFVMK
jgi:hypothetical protein